MINYLYSLDEICYLGGYFSERNGFDSEEAAIAHVEDFVIPCSGHFTFWTAKIDRSRTPHVVTDKKRHEA